MHAFVTVDGAADPRHVHRAQHVLAVLGEALHLPDNVRLKEARVAQPVDGSPVVPDLSLPLFLQYDEPDELLEGDVGGAGPAASAKELHELAAVVKPEVWQEDLVDVGGEEAGVGFPHEHEAEVGVDLLGDAWLCQ